MIDVKGIRSRASGQTDPSDPLGIKEPERNNDSKALSGLALGLAGVALYLRSFLWPDKAAGAVPDGAKLPAMPEDGSVTRASASHGIVAGESAETPEDGSEQLPDENAGVSGPFLFPSIFGSLGSVVHAPVPVYPLGPDIARTPANSYLPPFVGMQDSPLGTPLAPATFGGGIPQVSQSGPEVADGAGASGDEKETGSDDRNRAPRNTGPVNLADVGSGAMVAMSLSYFLSQTFDPEGSALSVLIGDVSSGTLSIKGDGWRYQADTDYLGEVEIDYMVSDGATAVAQTAIFSVIENVLEGTSGDDLIVGAHGRDAIHGLEGDDNLAGLEGRDRIYGDGGDDNIAGGDENDSLFGGEGDDLIVGGSGNDWISGGAGHDRIYGGDGADVIYGDAGNDEVHGGAGDDVLSGGQGDDLLYGGEGDDVVVADAGADEAYGDAGDDILFGGEGDDFVDGGADDDIATGGAGRDSVSGGTGDDTLSGGEGEDTVDAGHGDDIVVADDDRADDHYIGADGYDTLDYSAGTDSVAVDFIQGLVSGESVGDDSFESFEHLVGSTGNDSFLACDGQADLTGNGGADLFSFVQGDTVDIIQSIYQINDFGSDDRIWIESGAGHKEIRKAQNSLEDRIEDNLEDYADSSGADEPRLSYHHDWTETYRRTVIEVDFDRDDNVDLQVMVEGEHVFVTDYV